MKKETWIKLAVASLVVAVLGVCYTVRSCSKDRASQEIFLSESLSFASQETACDTIVCYITGAVVNPGVYALQEPSRITDLVEAAGGFSEKADQISVNLAELLFDGCHIHIYETGELQRKELYDGRINLNSCTRDELLSLPGIGEKKADAIISYRSENGRFSSVEDIMNVSGIGQAMFEEIKDYIKVQGQ